MLFKLLEEWKQNLDYKFAGDDVLIDSSQTFDYITNELIILELAA